MSDRDLKSFTKLLLRNCKKLQRSLADTKSDKSHSLFFIQKSSDKVTHYLDKIHELLPSSFLLNDELSLPFEVLYAFLSLWETINDFIVRMQKHPLVLDCFTLLVKLIQIPQYQPLHLADFPAPDELSSQTEQLLNLYYTNLVKTALFIISALNCALLPSLRKKKITTYQFSYSIKALNTDLHEEIARIFVLISHRLPELYELIFETLMFISNEKVDERSIVVLTDEVKMNYPSFYKWESYSNYVTSSNSTSGKLYTALKSISNSWCIHFEIRSGFAFRYFRCWAEFIKSILRTDYNEYPGYTLICDELLMYSNHVSNAAISPIYVVAQAYASFCILDMTLYSRFLENKTKHINFYDVDSMGDYLITEHFLYTYFLCHDVILNTFDYDSFKKTHLLIFESDSYALLCMTLSTIYQILPVVNSKIRKSIIGGFMLSNKIFNKLFCHWHHNVRIFYHELLLYRCTVSPSWNRIKNNCLLKEEKKKYSLIDDDVNDLIKYDKKVIHTINSKIDAVKSAEKNGFGPEEKKLSVYIQPALKDFSNEWELYQKWEATNDITPYYQLLEMTRLSKWDQNSL
ncbi:THO complex subunitTHOC2 C-terminal domain-containing protein [Entamoeba marina]